MQVYGDIARRRRPADLLSDICADLARAEAAEGLTRHAALVSALIVAGEMLQGVADAEFVQRREDARSPAQDGLAEVLLGVAGLVQRSWTAPSSDGAAAEEAWAAAFARVSGKVEGLAGFALPAEIEVKQPEGYAFYALYPEAYLEAALALPPGKEWRVLGLRSIGTSLAAVVAAALGAPPPLTARPTGHPFDRRLAPSRELRAELERAGHARFAVVDEGPGLSGSSFAAAIELLEECGVPPDRMHALPGHDGDLGPQAGPERRARWSRTRRHLVSTDALLLESGRLQAWAESLVGAATAPLEDLSGGGWRGVLYSDEAAWTPANAAQERRKFLMRTAEGAWLLKFAGLGRIGERKMARARALHAEGFTPEPAGLVHGFLVERWCEDLRPLPDGGADVDHLAAYLAFRARSFPAEPGASLPALFEMARANTAEALGDAAAGALEPFRPSPALAACARPVEIDGRLHRWEWLISPTGACSRPTRWTTTPRTTSWVHRTSPGTSPARRPSSTSTPSRPSACAARSAPTPTCSPSTVRSTWPSSSAGGRWRRTRTPAGPPRLPGWPALATATQHACAGCLTAERRRRTCRAATGSSKEDQKGTRV
jgi:hypothetical protein